MDYQVLLREIDEALHKLAAHDHAEVPSGWLGRPGCTEEQIAAAESRLGAAHPTSFRKFLQTSDGWTCLSPNFGRLLSAEELAWFRDRNAEIIEIWEQDDDDLTEAEHLESNDCVRFRAAYLRDCLQISAGFDCAWYLLNPNVQDSSGEWEAWEFASGYPGAVRRPSFAALLENVHKSLQRAAYLVTVPVDEARLVREALPVLRESMRSAGVDASTAILRYMDMGDDEVDAWIMRGGTGPVLRTLEQALRNTGQRKRGCLAVIALGAVITALLIQLLANGGR